MAGHLMPAFAVSALYQKCPASLIGALLGKVTSKNTFSGSGTLSRTLRKACSSASAASANGPRLGNASASGNAALSLSASRRDRFGVLKENVADARA